MKIAMMIFNTIETFCSFIQNYEGELTVIGRKIYFNNKLIAKLKL
jgi:hypothetical protein